MTYDPFNVEHSSGIPLAYQVSTHDPDFAPAEAARAEELSWAQEAEADQIAQAEADEMFECEGHESLDGAHMGETVYCDGSCI